MKFILLRISLMLMVFFSVNQTWAGGFFLPDRGARALSHGGAFVVSADDLNAVWYNPANLMNTSQIFAAYIDLGLINFYNTFEREPNAQITNSDLRAKNQASMFPDPSFAIGSNFGLKKFMFAFALFGPYAGSSTYDENGPQRYSQISSNNLMLFYNFSAAYQPIPQLRIGLGFQIVSFMQKQRLKISAYPGVFGAPEDPAYDSLVEVDVKNMAVPNATFGLWGKPVKWLELGFSYQLPIWVKANGVLKVRKPSSYYFKDVEAVGQDISLELTIPMILRVGARYLYKELFDIEINFVWENWSVLNNVTVNPNPAGSIKFANVPGLGDYVVPPMNVTYGLSDTYSIRLGTAWNVLKWLQIRGGFYFETGSVPNQNLSVALIDSNKYGLTLGASFKFWKLRLDVTYAHVFMDTRVVRSSTKYQVNPLYPAGKESNYEDGPTIVGNGTYTSFYDIAAIQLSTSY